MNITHADASESGRGRKPRWLSILDWLGFAVPLIAGVIMLVFTGLRLASEPGDYASRNTMGLFVGAVACLFAASLVRPASVKGEK